MEKSDKLLVLDLDETLVFATETKLGREPDFIVGPYFIYKRPGLEEFLKACLQVFDIGIWTSSSDVYAKEIVNSIFGSMGKIKFLWSRQKCVRKFDSERQDYYFVKDLKKLKRKGYQLQKIIVVDDSREKFERNYGNAILIKEYNGEKDDTELQLLLKYLKSIAYIENVRVRDKKG